MINQTSNHFQTLTGVLSGLTHGQATTGNSVVQGASSQANDRQSFQQEGFNGSFSGFQQNVGQQYSLDNQQAIQLVSLFVQVLSEIMSNVINNSGVSAMAHEPSATTGNNNPATTVTAITAMPEVSETSVTTNDNNVTEAKAPASCPFSG